MTMIDNDTVLNMLSKQIPVLLIDNGDGSTDTLLTTIRSVHPCVELCLAESSVAEVHRVFAQEKTLPILTGIESVADIGMSNLAMQLLKPDTYFGEGSAEIHFDERAYVVVLNGQSLDALPDDCRPMNGTSLYLVNSNVRYYGDYRLKIDKATRRMAVSRLVDGKYVECANMKTVMLRIAVEIGMVDEPAFMGWNLWKKLHKTWERLPKIP